MPITSYCKKCARDVPVSERCPHCGAKLAKSAQRVAWCLEHIPVRDWMCWNAAMRIVLPAMGVLLVLILLLQALGGGLRGMEALLRGGLLVSLGGLAALLGALTLLGLILQGEDWLDCAVDSRGVHVSCYLPKPTALKLLARLKSPGLLARAAPGEPLLISSQELAWKDVARVQLWPDKTLILLYAPAWWMRLSLPCTPFTYEDSLSFLRDKLGRKKTVLLPGELVAPPRPKASKAPAPPPAFDEPSSPTERQEDFVPLQDVLLELQEARSLPPQENSPQEPGND